MRPSRHGSAAPRPTLVVLRALGLGDLLTGVPALRGLRAGHPRHRLVLAAPAWLAPLVDLLDGVVDEIVDVDFRSGVGTLAPALADADLAVNLHGRGPDSHAALDAVHPRRLLAFHDRDHAPDGPPWSADEHERHRWCRLLWHAAIAADPDDLVLPVPSVTVPGRLAGATVVHPGATAPARRWPVERWASVVRHERHNGRRVVLTGGPAEVGLAAAVARAAGLEDHWVLAGCTDLRTLAALVAAAGRVVCADTGVGHLATALATPSVVLFGPVPPAWWGPPRWRGHVALWAGRLGDPHGQRPDPGLLELSVPQVVAALDHLPDHVSVPRPGDLAARRRKRPHQPDAPLRG